MNWYEKLGRAVAEEFLLEENSKIEHQCGTVWIEGKDGTVAISSIDCEGDNDVE